MAWTAYDIAAIKRLNSRFSYFPSLYVFYVSTFARFLQDDMLSRTGRKSIDQLLVILVVVDFVGATKTTSSRIRFPANVADKSWIRIQTRPNIKYTHIQGDIEICANYTLRIMAIMHEDACMY